MVEDVPLIVVVGGACVRVSLDVVIFASSIVDGGGVFDVIVAGV